MLGFQDFLCFKVLLVDFRKCCTHCSEVQSCVDDPCGFLLNPGCSPLERNRHVLSRGTSVFSWVQELSYEVVDYRVMRGFG